MSVTKDSRSVEIPLNIMVQNVDYELFALVYHEGQASFGHYWVCIKQGLFWIKAEDETVYIISERKLFEAGSSQPSSVFYRKK